MISRYSLNNGFGDSPSLGNAQILPIALSRMKLSLFDYPGFLNSSLGFRTTVWSVILSFVRPDHTYGRERSMLQRSLRSKWVSLIFLRFVQFKLLPSGASQKISLYTRHYRENMPRHRHCTRIKNERIISD